MSTYPAVIHLRRNVKIDGPASWPNLPDTTTTMMPHCCHDLMKTHAANGFADFVFSLDSSPFLHSNKNAIPLHLRFDFMWMMIEHFLLAHDLAFFLLMLVGWLC